MTQQAYDVVVFGATGFTGRQVARYLATRAGEGVRWAVAGRNRGKLDALCEELAQGWGASPGVIIADSTDDASLAAMVAQTRVVLATAGPFAKYGGPVVRACVEHQVDYVDITGETFWVRSMIDAHHERAAREGTRIVPFCGFDSIPSDLGAWMLVQHLKEEHGQGCRRVEGLFVGKGGFNGGTLASTLNMAEQGMKQVRDDVLLLNPEDHQSPAERAASPDRRWPTYDAELGVWRAPFFMAPINTRVVRRSNALFDAKGEGYGARFVYHEAMETRSLATAWGLALVQQVFPKLLATAQGRALVKRFAPKPGEGPSEQEMEEGFFRCRLAADGEDGARVLGLMQDQGDPGNRATAKMVAEAALCLALERDALPGGPELGGVLTPAVALGGVLLERLRKAGMRVEVVEAW